MDNRHHQRDTVTTATAIQNWKRQLAACRRQQSRGDDQLWAQLAPWYDEWVAHNDYVELVLPRLRPWLGPDARVLEIGPGSGAFTLPLARLVSELVTVEPSAEMRQLLAGKLAQAGLSNVTIVPGRIEESLDRLAEFAPFTLTLASFSLYNVEAVDALVEALLGVTRHLVIVLGTGAGRTWRDTLYRQFRGEERQAPPQLRHLYPVLLEMDIYADVEILWASENYVYPSEDDLVAWWMRSFQLEESRRAELRAALLPHASRDGATVGLYNRRPMALVWIDRQRHLLAGNGRATSGRPTDNVFSD